LFNVRIVQSAQQFTLNPNYDQFSKANDASPLTTIELDSCILNNQICFPPSLCPFPHPHCCPTQWDNFTALKPCHYSSKSIVTITGQCWIGFRCLLGPFVLENPKFSHSSYFSRFSLETIMGVQMAKNSARNQTPIATFFPYSKLFGTNLVGQKSVATR
jgi:hypothetical protein